MARIPRHWRSALACSVAVGFVFAGALSIGSGAGERLPSDDLGWRDFARPSFIPSPPDNVPTPEKIALGEKLFRDPRLSANGKIACASCHDPRLAFTDGEPTGRGVTERRSKRHTPTLWNLAWAPTLLWDGRATSLEDQALHPLEHPDEMGNQLDRIVEWLSAEEDYRRDFQAAFPGDQAITPRNVLKAIAAYERTLVSPPTRFDRWISGDDGALTEEEKAGFAIFAGKGRCIACHSGFAFTDHSFHDIGLPTDDLGRGPVLGVPEINHGFKTPGLRELAWTAPYMHNGSLATLEDVIRHYESGGISRPSRSKDMPDGLMLSDDERAALIAFLGTLSSDSAPRPSREDWVLRGTMPATAQRNRAVPVSATTVSQREKHFTPGVIAIEAKRPLTILNDDSRTHNVRIFDSRFDFNSGAQEPGESVTLNLPEVGTFDAFCGIHPTMRLRIEVH